ncbi:Uncharacterized protein BW664_02014 [Bacillus mycoides]|nr:Uncharacterized protein BW664_02014 [Bacillus mycoides]
MPSGENSIGALLKHIALAWLLNKEGIDTVIPGGKREASSANKRKCKSGGCFIE